MRVAILAYHSILATGESRVPEQWSREHTVTEESLCAHMECLNRGGWHAILPDDLDSQERKPGKYVLITLDDGLCSDRIAAQVLKTRGLRAIFYVTWSNIGRPGYLNKNDIITLASDGFRIGSHGFTHTPLVGRTDDELHRELVLSRQLLSELLGDPVVDIALPFGRYDQRVLDAASQAGYTRIMTSDFAPAYTRRKVYPRLGITCRTSVADLKILLTGSRARISWRRALTGLRRRGKALVGSIAAGHPRFDDSGTAGS